MRVGGIGEGGRVGVCGWNEGPVLAPRDAFGDPLTQDGDLRIGESVGGDLDGRHALEDVVGDDALDEEAGLRVAGLNRFKRAIASVEAEAGLAGVLIRAVALEAVVGEDGSDIAREDERLGRGLCGEHRKRGAARDGQSREERQGVGEGSECGSA